MHKLQRHSICKKYNQSRWTIFWQHGVTRNRRYGCAWLDSAWKTTSAIQDALDVTYTSPIESVCAQTSHSCNRVYFPDWKMTTSTPCNVAYRKHQAPEWEQVFGLMYNIEIWGGLCACSKCDNRLAFIGPRVGFEERGSDPNSRRMQRRKNARFIIFGCVIRRRSSKHQGLSLLRLNLLWIAQYTPSDIGFAVRHAIGKNQKLTTTEWKTVKQIARI